MNDISIDIETLSTRFDAAVLSIGAVAFDRMTGTLGEHFYAEVELGSALAQGHVSASTLAWWMQQSGQAKGIFQMRTRRHLAPVLQDLKRFFEQQPPRSKPWGNGAGFDITILEHAYSRYDITPPWEFRDVRDMRTIVDAAKLLGFDRTRVAFVGDKHNALDDARHQAKVISACWAQLAAVAKLDRAIAGEPHLPASPKCVEAEQAQ